MNKLAILIALAAAAHATSLQAGIFGFLKGRPKPQGEAGQAAAPSSDSSRSNTRREARVDQHGSIMRTGSNTAARVTENGSIALSKGVVLVSSGDGLLRRPPVQISTPQGEVTVRGSAIVAALPDGSVKMTVLEGHAKGALGGKDMALDPGQLMIQRHETRDAVKVDLGALTASSTLLDGSQYQLPLPAAPQIQSEVVQQVQALGGSLALSGGSHQVANATELKMAKNADAAASSAGSTSGATLSISGSNYYGSSAVSNTIYTGSAGTLSSGTIYRSNGTNAVGPLLPASTPPSIPGTNGGNQGASLSGILTVSGSNIVLSHVNATSISGLNNPAWSNLPVSSGSLTLGGATTVNMPPAQPTGTVSGSGSFNQVLNGASGLVKSGAGTLTLSNGTTTTVGSLSGGSLVITPGSTQTGQLTTTTGATLSIDTVASNLVGQGTATTSTSPGTPLATGGVLQISGAPTSNAPTGGQAFNLIDWMALGGGSAPSPGLSGNWVLPDLTSFTTQWDMSSLNSMGIILVVGPGYTGPGSLPPAPNTTTPPAAQP